MSEHPASNNEASRALKRSALVALGVKGVGTNLVVAVDQAHRRAAGTHAWLSRWEMSMVLLVLRVCCVHLLDHCVTVVCDNPLLPTYQKVDMTRAIHSTQMENPVVSGHFIAPR